MGVTGAEVSGPLVASAGCPRDPMEEAAGVIRVEDAGAAAGAAAEMAAVEETAAAEAAGAGAPTKKPPAPNPTKAH